MATLTYHDDPSTVEEATAGDGVVAIRIEDVRTALRQLGDLTVDLTNQQGIDVYAVGIALGRLVANAPPGFSDAIQAAIASSTEDTDEAEP